MPIEDISLKIARVLKIYQENPEFFILAIREPYAFQKQAIGDNPEFNKLKEVFNYYIRSSVDIPADDHITAITRKEYIDALIGKSRHKSLPGGLSIGDDSLIKKFFDDPRRQPFINALYYYRHELEKCIDQWLEAYHPEKLRNNSDKQNANSSESENVTVNQQFLQNTFTNPDLGMLAMAIDLTPAEDGSYYSSDLQHLAQAIHNSQSEIETIDTTMDHASFKQAVFNSIDQNYEMLVEAALEREDDDSPIITGDKPSEMFSAPPSQEEQETKLSQFSIGGLLGNVHDDREGGGKRKHKDEVPPESAARRKFS